MDTSQQHLNQPNYPQTSLVQFKYCVCRKSHTVKYSLNLDHTFSVSFLPGCFLGKLFAVCEASSRYTLAKNRAKTSCVFRFNQLGVDVVSYATSEIRKIAAQLVTKCSTKTRSLHNVQYNQILPEPMNNK